MDEDSVEYVVGEEIENLRGGIQDGEPRKNSKD
jgi:hypothetical protein